MAGEQHSDHSRPLVNYNMDDGPPSHEADVRDGHPSTPSPEPQNNGDASHAHNLGAETFHPIPVPVEGDAVMIAMVNALNQAGSMLHQQHERIMALEAERQEARPQPVSRIQQRSEPTKKRGRRSPEPHASRARAHRDGGRARTSPRRGHSPDNNELSPLRSDEEDLHCPLSRAIMEAPLPKGMEKPPNLAVYDGTTDPDDHVDNVDAHARTYSSKANSTGEDSPSHYSNASRKRKSPTYLERYTGELTLNTSADDRSHEKPFEQATTGRPCKTIRKSTSKDIRTPTRRTEEPLDEEMNDETLRAELDLVEEIRSEAALRETTLKQKIALRHDAKVIKREFQVGTLVLRRNQKNPREGKLAANWEGPYRVRDKTSNGAYYLENLQGEQLARPWNAEKLRQYYS
ncbi:hypothetical protein KIW84_071077 [Lathyrus oleraceus]|uniref:Uncharacterized protein n=1 Tax=Pisum sativum TaxID=3888 RepID=A0A9D4VHV4_PEA|nr:hypothetical protein KIW84_071077 [Pisum sativum]